MKSGLRDRNNRCRRVDGIRLREIVSMKSGLRDRNNYYVYWENIEVAEWSQ